MRISDWSSDVCSSDLRLPSNGIRTRTVRLLPPACRCSRVGCRHLRSPGLGRNTNNYCLIASNEQMNALELLEQSPVMPVIVIKDIDTAVELALPLVAAGFRSLEFTLPSATPLQALPLIIPSLPAPLLLFCSVPSPTPLEPT